MKNFPAASLFLLLLFTVVGRAAEEAPSFRRDVMPVFMRAGCNSGGCHGSARGQDGFRLSLFGYDPAGDYQRVTREMAGRRINLAVPEESLLIQKAIGAVTHTGGDRLKKGDPLYNAVLRWIAAGAPDDPAELPRPMSLAVSPGELLLAGEGDARQMTVKARYSDGSERDVTSLALFLSNNEPVATVTGDGMIKGGERGEAFVMARFATFTVGAQVIVVPKDDPFTFPELPEHNYIDQFIHAKLRKMQIAPAETSDDDVFIRRAFIDIIGLLPTPKDRAAFRAETDPDKRVKLVETLLVRPEFADLWVMKWAELLKIRSSNDVSYKAALRYFDWLRDRLHSNVPFDEITREILTASGGTFENPATSYFQITTDPLVLAENTAQVFTGVRIQCAQCHNHPFDRWTMDDYYGFTSFFTQLGRKKGEDPRETIVFNRGQGEARHPVGNKPVAPKFLGGAAPQGKLADRRTALADWLTGPDNPYFGRNLANITWEHFFGRGIVEPVDDVRVSNPASNPELLDALGAKLVEYRYDFRRLVRDICTSRTYQLATTTNDSNALDERNFSHGAIRRMRAEVMLDCISEVTETRDKFRGLPLGARAVQIADGATSNYFLTTFGRAKRATVCSCEVVVEPNLSQALHLLNGKTVSDKLRNSPLLKRLAEQKTPPAGVVRELYLRALSREPTEEESARLAGMLGQNSDPRQASEDLLWALLNSQEFMFNH